MAGRHCGSCASSHQLTLPDIDDFIAFGGRKEALGKVY